MPSRPSAAATLAGAPPGYGVLQQAALSLCSIKVRRLHFRLEWSLCSDMHLVFIHERRQCVRTRMSHLPLVRLFDLPSSLQYTHWCEDTDITIYTACNPSFGRQGSLDAYNIQQSRMHVIVDCEGDFGEHCDTHQKGLRQRIRQHRAMTQESAMLYMTSAYDSVLALAVYLHVRDQDSVRQIWDGHDKCLLSTMEAKMRPCAADLTTDHDTV